MSQCCLLPPPRNINDKFEWKWQYLRRFLGKLKPVLPLLQEFFDIGKLQSDLRFSNISTGLLPKVVC